MTKPMQLKLQHDDAEEFFKKHEKDAVQDRGFRSISKLFLGGRVGITALHWEEEIEGCPDFTGVVFIYPEAV
ncbi:MAG: hypothetical protein OXH70_17470 [Acidobacteria bacterium]|nr:hypothetical protein [Acidobacteriota bacterium]